MSLTREQKAVALAELKDKFKKAKVAVFSQYSGLKVQDSGTIRRELYTMGVDYKVAKKTLIKMAIKDLSLPIPDESIMAGPISVIFGYDDAIAPLKKLTSFSKKFEGLKIMGGYMEGRILSSNDLATLAAIPSKEELLTKFVSILAAPLNSFARMLKSPIESFTRGLKVYSDEVLAKKS